MIFIRSANILPRSQYQRGDIEFVLKVYISCFVFANCSRLSPSCIPTGTALLSSLPNSTSRVTLTSHTANWRVPEYPSNNPDTDRPR